MDNNEIDIQKKSVSKKEIRGRDKFNKYKFLLNLASGFLGNLPFKLRLRLFECSRMTKGNKGIAIRYVLIKTLTKKCGDNVSIQPNVYIFNPQNLSVGDNVSIHPMCYIECGNNGHEGVTIGNDVSIAHGVSIIANSHKFQNTSIPIKDQGMFEKAVTIKNNVWVGAKATILHGITIGEGCIIAANAVVTKEVVCNTIVGGVPARVIKKRSIQ